jgi:hypothetical protein
MGCTARGGDSIHIKKRLLAIAVVGAVLVISAVMVASLKGNDKPEITTNPPTDNEQPASTPQPAVYYTDSPDDYWTKKPHPQGPQMTMETGTATGTVTGMATASPMQTRSTGSSGR